MVTCAVQGLAAGEGAYGFLTGVKGRVLADLVVLVADDRLLLDLPAGSVGEVSDHILKYRIADRVELEAVETAVLRVAGPDAGRGLASLVGRLEGGLPAAPWGHRGVEIAGVRARLVRRGNVPVDAYDLRLAPADLPAVRDALAAAGAAAADAAAWEALRVAAGIPRFGLDFGRDHFPQETGLGEAGVAYDKGCYLGQEVVARIHYRGGVNRRLCGLELDGETVPVAGSEVLHDGRSAGKTGSALRVEAGVRALAILHQRVEAGAGVEVEGTGRARVVALPFGPR